MGNNFNHVGVQTGAAASRDNLSGWRHNKSIMVGILLAEERF